MSKAGRGAVLLCAALLAGCAGGQGAGAADEDVPAAAAVRAFANICGRLEGPEVAQRAGNLGFVPIDAARQAAMGLSLPQDGSVQIMARPATAPGAMSAALVWNARAPSCEVAIGGADPAALEREFDRMVETLRRQGGLQVSPVPPPAGPSSGGPGMRLLRLVVMVSPQQLGAAPQVVALRSTGEGGPEDRLRMILSLHVARPVPGGGAPAIPPPATALGPAKN